MDIHIKYMKRCIELATRGIRNTYPNPMVGCIIVHNNKIIGEGYHEAYGSNHAEVNAINSVINQDLLSMSTLYVNLEPCNHFGKTPPCTKLIIDKGIKNVIIGSRDPNSLVKGGGINTLISSGCNVEHGIMKDKCDKLNKRFFTFHNQRRPYVILKWAESKDGFISPRKSDRNEQDIFWISNEQSKKMSHYFRSQEHSILVGVQTVIDDDPELTTRLVDGNNPTRIVLDPNNRIPSNSKVLSNESETIIFSSTKNLELNVDNDIIIEFELDSILEFLYKRGIQSVIVEGGAYTIQKFINTNKWDCIRIFKSNKNLNEGLVAPKYEIDKLEFRMIGDNKFYEIFKN
jgi:diaminohydroxyphosphoribosylaminopyrimidine deaminase/5-amino-6-(5-phosphoribosylamino)uracil reductase